MTRIRRMYADSLSWLVFLTGSVLMAPAAAQRFDAGLLAGISTSQVSGDNLAGFDKIGFAAGVFAAIESSETVSWEMDILYVQKGSRKASDPERGDYVSYMLSLHYVEVPLLFRFRQKRFLYSLGPSLATLVRQKEEDFFGTVVYSPPRPFRRTEFALNAGIQYNLSEKLSFLWRLNNSVSPIRPHASGQAYRWNRGQYSTVLMFVLHYEFGGG